MGSTSSSTLIEFSNSIADAVEQAGKSVVAIVEGGQSGVCGTIWHDGVAVTAAHTLRGRDEVTLVLPSGESTTANVAGRDPGTDIAALKFSASAVSKTQFASLEELKVGHVVLAIGRRPKSGVRASYGILSSIGEGFRTWSGGRIDVGLRLDLDPYRGFSGGALVDGRGRVIGINTSGPHRTVLTIPNTTIDRVVAQLLEKGHIARGYIGVGVQPVEITESLRRSASVKQETGLMLIMVSPEAPAEKAGLLVGDIVLQVNGSSVTDPRELQAVLDSESVGKQLKLNVIRGGKPFDATVIVAERGK
ncbi:MAG TPA: S1C family serine protease [Terriglobales bacterium]|nr:S1C family serine protease [Terriglobales bacterium]